LRFCSARSRFSILSSRVSTPLHSPTGLKDVLARFAQRRPSWGARGLYS
jgi:hypothetical protein